MNNQTNRTVLTSQFSEYETPSENEGFLESWLNKLKSDRPNKTSTRERQFELQFKSVASLNNHHPQIKSNRVVSEFLDKQNVYSQPIYLKTKKVSQKPYVEAMKALQGKVKTLESQKQQLKHQLQEKDYTTKQSKIQIQSQVLSLRQKYQRLMMTNNEYRMKIGILQTSLCETDRLKIQNIRSLEEIKRLERDLILSEKSQTQMAHRYQQLLKELQNKITSFNNLQFQYKLVEDQLQTSKGEIKFLKMKLLNSQYNQEQQKNRAKAESIDYTAINEQLTLKNQKLQKKLFLIEETYLSELQKQQNIIQSVRKDNEVLKQKCSHLKSQLKYFKDSLHQKQNTLVELCKSRDISRDQSGLRDAVSGRMEELLNSQKGIEKQVDDFIQIDDGLKSMADSKSIDKPHNKSFQINSRFTQSQVVKNNKKTKNKSKDKRSQTSKSRCFSQNSRRNSKQINQKPLPFENVLIKLKSQQTKIPTLQSDCQCDKDDLIKQNKKLKEPLDTQDRNKILLIQAEKQAIRLYQIHQTLLQSLQSCSHIQERGQCFGRLRQLNQEIKLNNQKIHMLKQNIEV